jgi:hypothetical protein
MPFVVAARSKAGERRATAQLREHLEAGGCAAVEAEYA